MYGKGKSLASLKWPLIISDFILLNVSFHFTFFLLTSLHYKLPSLVYFNHLLLLNIAWVLSAVTIKMYVGKTLNAIEDIYRKTWRMVLLFLVFYIIAAAIFSVIDKGFLVTYASFSFIFFGISRFMLTYVSYYLEKKANKYRRIAILGYNEVGMKLAEYFQQKRSSFSFQGFFDDERANYTVNSEGRIISPIENCIEFAVENNISEIYSTILPHQDEQVDKLIELAESHCVRVKFVSDTSAFPYSTDHHIEYFNDFHVISLRSEPLLRSFNRLKKRAFDIVLSGFIIVFILSWLIPIMAILIKIESKGPVFFRQLRSGKNNRPFWCYKFRSMTVNSNSDSLQATKNDSRITKVGAFLRKTSLDEFPQFLNVLLGDMSIAGPRPHMLKHTEEYRKVISKYMVRHFVKPGITGWAQVNGFRGETQKAYLMQKRVEHDIWYMENWSLMLDVRIVFMTIINIFKGEDKAY